MFTGVSMTIPEGAVRQDQSVDIYLAVLRDDKDRPKLTGTSNNIVLPAEINLLVIKCILAAVVF